MTSHKKKKYPTPDDRNAAELEIEAQLQDLREQIFDAFESRDQPPESPTSSDPENTQSQTD